MHPVSVVAAFWKEDVNPWEGMQSVVVDDLVL